MNDSKKRNEEELICHFCRPIETFLSTRGPSDGTLASR